MSETKKLMHAGLSNIEQVILIHLILYHAVANIYFRAINNIFLLRFAGSETNTIDYCNCDVNGGKIGTVDEHIYLIYFLIPLSSMLYKTNIEI